MGIKLLNRFLLDNCSRKSIYSTSFSAFKNKTIVIDASIYIYKFVSDGVLLENLFTFVSMLLQYKITPIFVFDGKPPAEKMDVLKQRKLKKKEAQKQYNELKVQIDSGHYNDEEKKEIKEQLEILEKQIVNISKKHIEISQELLKHYGIAYYVANGEADLLCASLVLSGNAWACISDDMDMLVYGCVRIIRQISLLNHTCMYYDLQKILKDLDMSLPLFRQIVVLSGTDYNMYTKTSIHETIKWYYEYQKDCGTQLQSQNNSDNGTQFYDWLHSNTKYIENIDKLKKIYQMFIIDYDNFEREQNTITKCSGDYNKEKIYELLQHEGFLVLNH